MGFLADGLRAAGDRLFRTDDEHAIAHGWQVRSGRFGLSHTYRDARFDQFAGCDFCHGWGSVFPGHPCVQCGGTGRITIGDLRQDDGRLVR
jgi:RecJ-like exonuclease